MAHLIKKHDHAFYGSNTAAWHKLGTVVTGQPNSEEALRLARLDWTVEKEPAFAETKGGFVRAPGCFLTVRSDLSGADRVLGIVGSRYTPIQNTEAFEIADALVGEGGAQFESAGSLRNGKRVWMLAQLPDALRVKDDTIAQYLLLHNSHDGSSAMEALLTPIRVVCNNTLTMALGNKMRSRVSIRHTGKAKDKIAQARRILKISGETFGQIGETFGRWADTKVSRQYVNAFLRALVPAPENASASRATNQRDDIRGLFAGGQIGASQDAVRGTAYGLFNAVTQYIDRSRTTRTSGGRSAGETRLDSSWFGSGATFRQSAAALLDQTIEYAAYDGDSVLDLVDGPGAQASGSVSSLLDSMTIATRN